MQSWGWGQRHPQSPLMLHPEGPTPFLWYSQTKRLRPWQSHEPWKDWQAQWGFLARGVSVSSFPYCGEGNTWGSWLSNGSQSTLCLPACCPGPGTVPGIGFKLVNNFTFGLVDVTRTREVLPTACTCLPASSLFSFHSVPSPSGLSLSSSSYPQGPMLLCPRVPLGCLVQALYDFSLLSCAPLLDFPAVSCP